MSVKLFQTPVVKSSPKWTPWGPSPNAIQNNTNTKRTYVNFSDQTVIAVIHQTNTKLLLNTNINKRLQLIRYFLRYFLLISSNKFLFIYPSRVGKWEEIELGLKFDRSKKEFLWFSTLILARKQNFKFTNFFKNILCEIFMAVLCDKSSFWSK